MDRRRRPFGVIAIAITAVSSCTDDPPEPVPAAELVDHRAWVLAPLSEDPFADRRPPGAVCDPQGVRPEFLGPDEVFEIDTGACNHATVVQETLADLEPGAEIDVRLWHYDLVSAEAGTAYTAISLAGEIVWEHEMPIPGEAMLVKQTVITESGAPMGTSVYFFVGNHGVNQYELIDFDRVGDKP